MSAQVGWALRRQGASAVCLVPTTLVGADEDCVLSPLYVGLCGTDLQILNGCRPDSAEILGHEGAVRVEHAPVWAKELYGIERGRRYLINPVNPRTGRIVGHNAEGLLQSRLRVAKADMGPDMLVPLSEAGSDRLATLAEPLAAAMYGVRLVSYRTALTDCAVVGAGPMGLVLATYLRLTGASSVRLYDRRAEPLDFAVTRGLMRAHDVAQMDGSASDLPPVDAAFFCGTRHEGGSGLEAAIKMVREGGCIDLVAAPPILPEDLDFQVLGAGVRGRNLCGHPRGGAFETYRTARGRKISVTGHRGTSRWDLLQATQLLALKPDIFFPIIGKLLAPADAAGILTRACLGERWGPGKLLVRVNSCLDKA